MTIVLRGATVVDGTGADPRLADVVLADGRIAEITGPGRAAAAEQSIDLEGRTVLPGLIDAHSHLGILSYSGDDVPAAVTAARIFRNCELALDAGFTTVRDVAGIDGGVARAVELGLVRGPRILPSGPALCQTGGHGDDRAPFSLHHHQHEAAGIPGLSQIGLPCDGPDGVRLGARMAFRRGATQIKVCVTGGVVSLTDSLEDTQFTVDELMAAVAEADARGTYVTAHAHNSAGIRNGLAAGVACFEHGTFLDEATARAMAAAGAALVPTLTVARLLRERAADWGVTEDQAVRIEGVEDAMAKSLTLARECGVVVGLGTDLLGAEQDRRGLELVIRAALSDALDAVNSATAVNARIIRRDASIGTIEVGKVADVIAIDGDPLADPARFDDPDKVVLVLQAGRIAKHRL